MKSDSVKNMAASVRDKLLQMARQSGKPFQSLLIQYGLERFLYRLSQSSFKDEFILKGGLLLVGMGFPLARTTRDIDFLGLIKRDSASVSAAIQQIGKLELNDGIAYEFNDLNIEVMSDDSEYPGMRLTFTASLGKARFPMQIDVGFGDAIIPAAKEMTFPTLLDMEPPVVKAYSIETIVAEKFEAALDLADLNSRMKDFYDMWILSQTYSFQGIALQESIIATCQRRNTALNSSAEVFTKEFADNSDKRTQWISFLRKNKMLDIPEDFSVIMEEIQNFLQPIAKAIEKGVHIEKTWPPKGKWQKTI